MDNKIKERLQGLYNERLWLEDESKVWIKQRNALSRKELLHINSIIIKELELLLNNI